MSRDHTPAEPDEKLRIETAKMSIDIKPRQVNGEEVQVHNITRVNGFGNTIALSMSRAFGDVDYKKSKAVATKELQAVISVPEIRVHQRDPRDMYLVLACDGVWNVMTNDEVAQFVVDSVNELELDGAGPAGLLAIVGDKLVKKCLEKGSDDNMTVVVADVRLVKGKKLF